MRKYELPYNFDKALIDGYRILDIPQESIDCIYVPPFLNDYQSILRLGQGDPNDMYQSLTYEEYIDHINYINQFFPNKL